MDIGIGRRRQARRAGIDLQRQRSIGGGAKRLAVDPFRPRVGYENEPLKTTHEFALDQDLTVTVNRRH